MLVFCGFSDSGPYARLDYSYFLGTGDCSAETLARLPFPLSEALVQSGLAKNAYPCGAAPLAEGRSIVVHYSMDDSSERLSGSYPTAYSFDALMKQCHQLDLDLHNTLKHSHQVNAGSATAKSIAGYHQYLTENPDNHLFPLVKGTFDDYLSKTIEWDITLSGLKSRTGPENPASIQNEIDAIAEIYARRMKEIADEWQGLGDKQVAGKLRRLHRFFPLVTA